MVRRVLPDGTISTAVGTGERGYGGDGGPATRALLDLVHGVAALPDGSFVVDDMGNNRIRRVWPDNTITTVVGTGENGFAGDGGPASAAAIALPRGVAARPNGELLIADTGNARVRRVSPAGVISTVAGTGEKGFSGDAGPATAARLNRPFAVAPLPGGGVPDRGPRQQPDPSRRSGRENYDGGRHWRRALLRRRWTCSCRQPQPPARCRGPPGRRLSDCRHVQPPRSSRRPEREDHDRGGHGHSRVLGRRGSCDSCRAQPPQGAGGASGWIRVLGRRRWEQPRAARPFSA